MLLPSQFSKFILVKTGEGKWKRREGKDQVHENSTLKSQALEIVSFQRTPACALHTPGSELIPEH